MSQHLTLKDIAAIAGVSEMTVSRALRGANDVSEATRKRILDAAAEIGYVPNKIAGALASNKVDLVGVVIPSIRSYVFSQVLDGISSALAETNLRPVFGITDYNLDVEEDVIREMLAWRPSGLIIAGLEHSDRARKILRATDTPIVEIMDSDGEPIDMMVGISHRKAGYDMALSIVKQGYRKIGFIGTKMSSDFRAQKRLEGFRAGLEETGIKLIGERPYEGASSFVIGREKTADLLADHPDIECIYCSTDVLAVGSMMHCIAEGLKVPDDLAFAGFNNLELAQGLPLEIATTDSLRFEIGERAGHLIAARNSKDAELITAINILTPKIRLGQTL